VAGSDWKFGLRIQTDIEETKLVLASGGTGQVNELWEYSDHWLYGEGFSPFNFGGNPWAGLSMKIYTIPEPATLLLLGLGGLMIKKQKR
jgi:hypothetical protein